MQTNNNLQVWANFFEEIDREHEEKRLKALQEAASRARAHALTPGADRSLSTEWMQSLQQLQAQKRSPVAALQTLSPAELEPSTPQHSLQNCLTQALCILDEVKHTPSVHGIDSQFGDFQTLLHLLEEANWHLQTFLME